MKSVISITLTAYGISHTAELSEDCTASELMEVCAMLAESIGFSPALVVDGMQNAIKVRQ